MSKVDIEYHKLCSKILKEGYEYTDKSRDIVCKQISSYTLELEDIYKSFPLITTKKMFTKGIVGELLWFLRGDNNIKYLLDNNINIWNKDAYNWYIKNSNSESDGHNHDMEDYIYFIKNSEFLYDEEITLNKKGDVGRNYGVQWRDWTNYEENVELHDKNYPDTFERESFDQIANLIQNLIAKPMSRRHVVTAWNPAELDETALPPCHWAFEVIPYPIPENVKELLPQYKYMFDLKWHQRSCDVFLGVPFNITSYALLMRIIGELTGYIPNKLIGDLSNVHFYKPHIELVKKQLNNFVNQYGSPDFEFSDKAKHYFQGFRNESSNVDLLDYVLNNIDIEDFKFNNYKFFPAIEAHMYEPKK